MILDCVNNECTKSDLEECLQVFTCFISFDNLEKILEFLTENGFKIHIINEREARVESNTHEGILEPGALSLVRRTRNKGGIKAWTK